MAGARTEWRSWIEASGVEYDAGDGVLERMEGSAGGVGISIELTRACRFASSASILSKAIAGLWGMDTVSVQIAGSGRILSPV